MVSSAKRKIEKQAKRKKMAEAHALTTHKTTRALIQGMLQHLQAHDEKPTQVIIAPTSLTGEICVVFKFETQEEMKFPIRIQQVVTEYDAVARTLFDQMNDNINVRKLTKIVGEKIHETND